MTERHNDFITMQQPTTTKQQKNAPRPGREKMTLQRYLRTFWMDYLLLAIFGVIGIVVNRLRPAPDRLFPVYFRNGEVVNPEFSYPLVKNIIPTWLSGLLAFIIPFVFIMLMQIRVRSFNDANTATMGLLYSIVSGAVFQVLIKWLIGGLRPHFLAVCKPSINAANANTGKGFDGIMFDRSICTGDEKEINFALQSMPSGHSTAAFASLLYCSLYLNGKLKIFANYRPQYWKLALFYTPLLGAVLLACSLTIDHFHHWYDVLAGVMIGTAFAFGSYRAQYASVWDYRFNHIPLPRVEAERGFDYHLDQIDPSLSGSRKGGWGNGHIHGAPFDATATVPALQTERQIRGELNV